MAMDERQEIKDSTLLKKCLVVLAMIIITFTMQRSIAFRVSNSSTHWCMYFDAHQYG